MIKAVSALLVGASLFASAPASAADYIRYDIGVVGTITALIITAEDSKLTPSYIQREQSSSYAFLMPFFAAGTFSYNSNPGGLPELETRRLTVTSTSMVFSQDRARSDVKFTGLQAQVSLCGTFSTIGGPVDFDPSCSTASSAVPEGDPNGAGSLTQFAGRVVSVKSSLVSATGAGGFIETPAVPEPATWAMMLVGFGAIGAMMRTSRRRRVAAL